MKGDCDKKRSELDEQILALHQSGVNRFAITSQLNISQKRVKGAYRRLGLEIGPIVKTTTQSTIDKGLALYRIGLGFKMAAAKVGIKPGLLIYHIRKRGMIRHNTRVWMKGRKIPEGYRRKPQYKASTLIDRAYKSEAKTLKALDVEHWSKHPEVIRFHTRKPRTSRFGWTDCSHRKIKRILRTSVWKMVRHPDKTNTLGTEIVGCSSHQLRSHLASHFTDSMSFDNYGRVLEVDHVVPCAVFDLRSQNQRRICFHFTNLMPCTVSRNRSKSAKISNVIQFGLPV